MKSPTQHTSNPKVSITEAAEVGAKLRRDHASGSGAWKFEDWLIIRYEELRRRFEYACGRVTELESATVEPSGDTPRCPCCGDRLENVAQGRYECVRAECERRAVSPPKVKCTGCNDRGEVGGLTRDGYDGEPCPFCTTQPPVVRHEQKDAYEAAAEVMVKDGERFRYLCEDIADRDERNRRNELLERMATMSLSASRSAVDLLVRSTVTKSAER